MINVYIPQRSSLHLQTVGRAAAIRSTVEYIIFISCIFINYSFQFMWEANFVIKKSGTEENILENKLNAVICM